MEGEQNTSPPLQYLNCFDIFQTFLFILFCPQGEVGSSFYPEIVQCTVQYIVDL